MADSDHPDKDILLAYLRDELTAAEAETVAMHLGDCETCVGAMDQTPAHRQLEQLLAASPAPDISADVQAISPLLQNLKTFRPTSGETACVQTIGFLESPESPGDLGRLGRYRVLEKIGSGGMGTVFKAMHPVMERIVALKVLSPRLVDSPEAVTRFQREIKLVAQLQHANIVVAYDADQVGAAHFLVMEYVDGMNLAELLRKRKRLSVRDAARAIRQAANGLQYAHDQGLIHRDLKPSNLMVSDKGIVKVMDLGLARAVEEAPSEPQLTGTQVTLGTPDYMAPEQARDAHSADARSDIYSLGATLYHLLSGEVPFPDGSAFERLMIRQTQDPKPLSEVAPVVPPALAEVVTKMMCRDPEGRYQTPAEVAQALAPFTRSSAGKQAKSGADPSADDQQQSLQATISPSNTTGDAPETAPSSASPAPSDSSSPASTDSPDDTGESGIDLAALAIEERASRPVRPRLPRADSHRAKWWRSRTILAGTAIAGLLLIALGIVGLQKILIVYPEGTLVVELNQPGAEVKVVGREVEFTGIDGKLTATLPEGEHTLKVSKDGFETRTTSFSIKRGQETPLQVTLMQKSPGPQTPARSVGAKLEPERVQPSLLGRLDPSAIPDELRSSDLPTQVVAAWKAHADNVLCVRFTPDGRYLLTAGAEEDSTVRVWDVTTGKELRRFERHTDGVMSLAVSPDGKLALSGDAKGAAWLWDVRTGETIKPMGTQREGSVLDLTFSADGRCALAGTNDSTLRLWNIESRSETQTLVGHGSGVFTVAFAVGGKRAFSGSGNQELRLWDLENGTELSKDAVTGWISGLAVAPDGRSVYAGGDTVHEWTLANDKLEHRRSFPRWHEKTITSISISPDGKQMVTVGYDGRVILWDVAAGEKLREWKPPAVPEGTTDWRATNSATFAPDGRHIATGNPDGTVWILRLEPAAGAYSAANPALPTQNVEQDRNDTVTPRDTSNMQLVFDMDFEDPKTSADLFVSGEDGHAKYLNEDGQHQLITKVPGTWWTGPGGSLGTVADYVCEVEARLDRPVEGGWGIAFSHIQESHCHVQVKDGVIRGTGQDDWIPVPALRPIDQFNTLRIEVANQKLRVFVNGQHVYSVVSYLLQPGGIHLTAFSDPSLVHARFDRFRVWRAEPGGVSPTEHATAPAYAADFASPVPEFPRLEKDAAGYADGKYFVAAEQGKLQEAGSLGVEQLGDFYAEVVGRVASGKRGAWALVIRSSDTESLRVELRDDAALLVRRVNGDTIRQPYALPDLYGDPWWYNSRPWPSLRPGNDFNKVGVAIRGDLLLLYFNGQWATDLPIPDFKPRNLMLGAEADAEPARAEFQSLKVWSLGDRTESEKSSSNDAEDRTLATEGKP